MNPGTRDKLEDATAATLLVGCGGIIVLFMVAILFILFAIGVRILGWQ